MRSAWAYVDEESGIDERGWLKNYILTNYEKKGFPGVKRDIISAFKEAHPMVPHKIDGGIETQVQMESRYGELEKRLPKWVDNFKQKHKLGSGKTSKSDVKAPLIDPFKKESKPRKTCGYNVFRKEQPELRAKLKTDALKLHPDDGDARKAYVNVQLYKAYQEEKEDTDKKAAAINSALPTVADKGNPANSEPLDEHAKRHKEIATLKHTLKNYVIGWAQDHKAVMVNVVGLVDENGRLVMYIHSSDKDGDKVPELECLVKDQNGAFTSTFNAYLQKHYGIVNSSGKDKDESAEPDVVNSAGSVSSTIELGEREIPNSCTQNGPADVAAPDTPTDDAETPPINAPSAAAPDVALSEDSTERAINAALSALANDINDISGKDNSDTSTGKKKGRKGGKKKGGGKTAAFVTDLPTASAHDDAQLVAKAQRGRKRKLSEDNVDKGAGPAKRKRSVPDVQMPELRRGSRIKKPTEKRR